MTRIVHNSVWWQEGYAEHVAAQWPSGAKPNLPANQLLPCPDRDHYCVADIDIKKKSRSG